MNTAQPTRPAMIAAPYGVRASALAAWQLVEDARNRTPHDRRPRNDRSDRSRVLAQRAVADRRAERARQAG
jgi:hypothetical protein